MLCDFCRIDERVAPLLCQPCLEMLYRLAWATGTIKTLIGENHPSILRPKYPVKRDTAALAKHYIAAAGANAVSRSQEAKR